MTGDLSHLNALREGLSREKVRRDAATGKERELRDVWVSQLESEIQAERGFLGIADELDGPEMSDDELLNALFE
jgi:hypothetical protein